MTICGECKWAKMPLGPNEHIDDRLAWQCHDGPPDLITGARRLVPCVNKNDGNCPDFEEAGLQRVILLGKARAGR